MSDPPAAGAAREPFVVRPERPEDHAAIGRLHRAAFPSALESLLVDRLRAAGRLSVSLVAERAGDGIGGHVAFSPVELPQRTGSVPRGAGLGPVAVREGHRRQGIAARLIRAGLERCAGTGFAFVVVLGDPAYYERFGFVPAGTYGLSDEYGGGDAFQVRELSAGSLPVGAGLVRYAPEFRMFAESDCDAAGA